MTSKKYNTALYFLKFIKFILPLFLALILFLYPIPGTGGVRNILFFGILLSLGIIWKFSGLDNKLLVVAQQYKLPLQILFILTCWMFLQSLLFGVDREESLNNLLEEWLLGGVVFSWLSWNIARIDTNIYSEKKLITWIAIAMLLHAIWLLFYQFQIYFSSSGFPYGSTPYARKDFISLPIGFAFVLLVSDLITSIFFKKRILFLPLWLTVTLFIPVLISLLTVKARNGIISVLIVLAVLSVAMFIKLWQEKRIHLAISMIIVPFTLVFILILANINTDYRWGGFIETIGVSTDIHNNKAWLDSDKYPFPKIASGTKLDASAYQRIAYGIAAIEGIVKHPMGYGYGLGGFGNYIKEQYGYDGFVSSHSGVLDFTLANGLVGMLLWITFCITLLRLGWKSFMTDNNPWGLLLILTLSSFFVRIVLDGHFGSFRLKMFALLMGVIYYLMVHNMPSSPSTNKTLS